MSGPLLPSAGMALKASIVPSAEYAGVSPTTMTCSMIARGSTPAPGVGGTSGLGGASTGRSFHPARGTRRWGEGGGGGRLRADGRPPGRAAGAAERTREAGQEPGADHGDDD